jgi:hypothetical protein
MPYVILLSFWFCTNSFYGNSSERIALAQMLNVFLLIPDISWRFRHQLLQAHSRKLEIRKALIRNSLDSIYRKEV